VALLKATSRSRGTDCVAKAIRACLLGGGVLLPWDSGLGAQSARASDNQVKAVFLFNFAQFVDWPAGAFPDLNAPLVIGVLGDDPFGPYLDETVRGETVRGRPLEVRRYQRIEDVGTCHILFVSTSEESQLEAILANLRHRAILTVGDGAGFAQRGGMIRFLTERNRIRMRINVAAAEAVQLTISSKLLRAAELGTLGKP
jgi:uncharacterized protein DUF4154